MKEIILPEYHVDNHEAFFLAARDAFKAMEEVDEIPNYFLEEYKDALKQEDFMWVEDLVDLWNSKNI